MKDLLRGERLNKMDDEALRYTASIADDQPLLDSVLAINKAHVIALRQAGILGSDHASKLLDALNVKEELPKTFEFEDVHMFVEQKVTEKVGKIGGYLNLGKSRNDQVAAAIRMSMRTPILTLAYSLLELAEAMVNKASKSTTKVIPVYTHLQVAQPSTMAHWLLAYEEMFMRDVDRLLENYDRVNCSPMGAGASTGTTVNIDRQLVAEHLGFKSVMENSLDAVSSRDFLIEFIYITTSIALTISRISEDINFMSNNEVGIIRIPDAYASTSSAMPQKKNSVVTEIARASSGTMLGNLVSVICIYKALPSAYNLDLQEMTPKVWENYSLVKETVDIMGKLVENIEVDEKRSRDLLVAEFSTAMELAEYITLTMKIPFRESHHIIGAYVRRCVEEHLNPVSLEAHSMLVNEVKKHGGTTFSYETYRSLLDPNESIIKKTIYGSPNPSNTEKMIRERRLLIEEKRRNVLDEMGRLNSVFSELNKAEKKIIGGEKA
ncbi:MAG: argininosuccinate lyase [Nitrososphaeria archaeon]